MMESAGGMPPPTGGCSNGGEPSVKRVCRVDERHLLKPEALRHAILHTLNEPVVFRGYLAPSSSSSSGGGGGGGGWPCLGWPLDRWMDVFGDQQLDLRVGQRTDAGMTLATPQWEGECLKASMTLGAFLAWAQGHTTTATTTCSTQVSSTTHWAYFDYYYLRDLAQCRLDLNWGALGFPERGTADSTLWIGSAGANTPCHIDTYGINLVAQVYGHKRWVMFPECQSKFLGATRIPYEESSIYSSAGFPRPSRHSHPALAHTTPHVVTLGPGDVLFVPRRWWHSVENLDLALSVNTWVEVEGDAAERVKEAMVMFQVGSLCQGVTALPLLKEIFNPNMLDIAAMTSTDLLALLLRQVRAARHSRESGTQEDQEKHQPKGHSAKNDLWTDADWLVEHGTVEGQGRHESKEQSATQGHSMDTDFPAIHKRISVTNEGHGRAISKSHSAGKSHWSDRDRLALYGITPVPSMSFLEYQRGILGVKEEEEEKEKEKEEGDKECQYQGVPESAEREDGRDLKLLIDVFTDRRVVNVLQEVLDEKLGDGGGAGGGGDGGGGCVYQQKKT